MDNLLLDIKNFLKKLENGQLDIEAGQWELHKDIANMKRSVEELKKLKEDVEVMRINNAEQMEVIKNLETKLKCLSKHYEEQEPVTVSETSVEYETVYRRPKDGQQPPKGYKKRKCHLVRSEEIIEITSELSDKKSATDSGTSTTGTDVTEVRKQPDNEPAREDDSTASAHKKHVHILPAQDSSKAHHQLRTANNGILQRYLKDSIKYRDRNTSCSTERTPTMSRSSGYAVSRNNFWDEYSSRLPQNQMAYHSRVQNVRNNSSGSTETTESVIPKRLVCPKNMRKFALKADFPDRDKQSLSVKHINHCKVCSKGFSNKKLLRAHRANHVGISRKQRGFKCSYCDKICSTLEKLTLHLKNCRIIMRSQLNRR